MNATPRTEFGDITPAGAELDESALSGINGGQPTVVTGEYYDPPGICCPDS